MRVGSGAGWFVAAPSIVIAAVLAVAAPQAGRGDGRAGAPVAAGHGKGGEVDHGSPDAARDEPSETCIKRFRIPFRGFGGREGEESDPRVVAIGGTLDGGRIDATVTDPADTPAEAWAQVVDRARADLQKAVGAKEIDTRIAILPDPIDSGLQYYFDTTLQAIRLGVERGTPGGTVYYRDRAWLPWDDRLVADDARKDSEACRRTTPGVILFRGSDGTKGRVLALFLVGETPTVGVHPTAMRNALEAAARLTGADRLHLIGPTYSGTARSLRLAFDQWAATSSHPGIAGVDVVTGSANGPEVPRLLTTPPGAPSWGTLTLHTTTIAQHALECTFFHFLNTHLGVSADGAGRLHRVAFLRESGTEFGALWRNAESPAPAPPGAASKELRCLLQPEVQIGYPFHVSTIRDAYEEMDRRYESAAGQEVPGRRTTLDVSLHEPRRPLDMESIVSMKTTSAQDVALSHVLAEVSREGIRYVGVQATDVADAIFLARKIRDVAPDVRLAFFDADVLLTHPSFNHDLFGSFVVSAYPFLGTDDFADAPGKTAHDHQPFESAMAEGAFNATLATSGFPATALREYAFSKPGDASAMPPLPAWIATIGRGEILPVAVRPSIDCAGAGYGRDDPSKDGTESALCGGAPTTDRMQAYDDAHRAELNVDPDVTPPRLWHFVLALLVLGAIVDRHVQTGARAELQSDDVPRDLAAGRDLDLALGRAKWSFYAVVRALVLFGALSYVTAIEMVALLTYHAAETSWYSRPLSDLALLAGVVTTGWMGRQIHADARRYWTWRGRLRAFVERGGARARSALTRLGFAELSLGRASVPAGAPADEAREKQRRENTHEVAYASYAQLRTLSGCVALTLLLFAIFFVQKLGEHDVGTWLVELWRYHDRAHVRPLPAMTLFVLRSLPLANGVSPSAPGLLSLGCAYVWAVGRMARLHLAYMVGVITPDFGVVDAISTPIRAVLFPARGARGEDEPNDRGFTAVERALLDAIWRPSAGAGYFFSLVGILVFPFVLFALKQPTTLDGKPYLFFASLGLCLVLICATLVQLAQYWLSLDHLLKRVMEHPLGRAFTRVDPFVRDPLDDLVSRSPNDLLRLAGCARKLAELVALAESRLCQVPGELARLSWRTRAAHNEALGQSATPVPDGVWDAAKGVLLGRSVLSSASEVMRILEKAWTGDATAVPPPRPARGGEEPAPARQGAEGAEEQPRKEEPAAPADALTPVEGSFAPAQLAWLREGQAFVATVAAMLVNRHVRQFRYFLYTLTGCALLLLLTFVSYPFEPHRLLLTFIWAVMGSVVASGFWIFLEMDRSTLLSYISGTTPGELTLNGAFALRVFTWAVLPLLSVAAAQYPQIAGALFRFLDPVLRALR